jgi:hypothetical protein
VDGNILNSRGAHVGMVVGSSIFDLRGQKIYDLKVPTFTNSLVNWSVTFLQMPAVLKGVWTNRPTGFFVKSIAFRGASARSCLQVNSRSGRRAVDERSQIPRVKEIFLMSVKTAQSLIEEFVRAVRPPRGCAIVLAEIVPSPEFDLNWLASAGHMSAAVLARYDSTLLDLKRKNQRINWDGVTDMDSEGVSRRIARYSSEVK